MQPTTQFILFGILCVLPIIIFGVATTRMLLKDNEKDNYEYKQPKNFSEYEDTRN
jgi:hypothetical protein